MIKKRIFFIKNTTYTEYKYHTIDHAYFSILYILLILRRDDSKEPDSLYGRNSYTVIILPILSRLAVCSILYCLYYTTSEPYTKLKMAEIVALQRLYYYFKLCFNHNHLLLHVCGVAFTVPTHLRKCI